VQAGETIPQVAWRHYGQPTEVGSEQARTVSEKPLHEVNGNQAGQNGISYAQPTQTILTGIESMTAECERMLKTLEDNERRLAKLEARRAGLAEAKVALGI
jgi:hypothetical protein